MSFPRIFQSFVVVAFCAMMTSNAPAAPASAAPLSALPAPIARTAPAYVVIKADDLRAKGNGVSARWQKLVDFTCQREIKIGIGIIADSLEADNPDYFDWIKKQNAAGQIEFWNHGYDHKKWSEAGKEYLEFSGTSFERQKEHLERANALAREKLGFAFETFGAPFNATDENTAKALAQSEDIKIWLYGNAKNPVGKLVLTRNAATNIEAPIFKPNALKFAQGYNKFPDQEIFVIQGHPDQWDDAEFAQFVGIVDFLTRANAQFVTPADYRKMKVAQ